MNVSEQFRAAVAVAANRPATAGPHLTGSQLAWAAAHVLGTQGAGISVSTGTGLRLPWGASSEAAATTERLQFTTGEGPCLTAYDHQVPIMAVQELIALSWPIFAEQLHRRTPYRSVFAAPLHRVGVVELYFTDPDGCAALDISAALTVTHEILTAMVDEDFLSTLDSAYTWRIPSIARRTEIAMAIGMLIVPLGVDSAGALALLRAHAFATNQDLEDAAQAVLTGALQPNQLAS